MSQELVDLANHYRVVTITGPRQAGKTTLTKLTFPKHHYVTLEDPDIRRLATDDPRAFFRLNPCPVILDEIQRAPHLLSYIQTMVDEDDRPGLFILTGSHQLALNEAITQSLAGRTALLQLYPMSIHELSNEGIVLSQDDHLLYGSLPHVHFAGLNPTRYYRNYFQTYVERDVRQMINLKDITLFEKFMRLCAGRIGQLLNNASLANEVGVNSKTIEAWLSILEASYVIIRLQPYYENLGKRLTKSPKLYFVDVGLATYLLGIENATQLARDPLRGQLFENVVILEMIKSRANKGLDPSLYFYRDSNQNEVDIIYKRGNELIPIEIKASETYNHQQLKGVRYFQKVVKGRAPVGYVVYAGKMTPELDEARYLHFSDTYQVFD